MEDGDGVFEGGPEQPSVEYKSTRAGHSPRNSAISFRTRHRPSVDEEGGGGAERAPGARRGDARKS